MIDIFNQISSYSFTSIWALIWNRQAVNQRGLNYSTYFSSILVFLIDFWFSIMSCLWLRCLCCYVHLKKFVCTISLTLCVFTCEYAPFTSNHYNSFVQMLNLRTQKLGICQKESLTNLFLFWDYYSCTFSLENDKILRMMLPVLLNGSTMVTLAEWRGRFFAYHHRQFCEGRPVMVAP